MKSYIKFDIIIPDGSIVNSKNVSENGVGNIKDLRG